MSATAKLLIATWIVMALLIGGGVGYVVGSKSAGERVGVGPSQPMGPGGQGNYPPINQGQPPVQPTGQN